MSAATLRDQFAMAVLQGTLAGCTFDFENYDEAAALTYALADAMLRARERLPVGEAIESDFGDLDEVSR